MSRIGPGSPEPLGVTPKDGGVDVAVYSAHATSIEFCIFDAGGEQEIERVALPERTGDVFHAFIGGVFAGTRYGLRAHGPFDPRNGHRFNPAKLLIDPYARALDRMIAFDPAQCGGETSPDYRDSAPHVATCVVTAPARPAESRHVSVPWSDTIVYELNVRGFSKTLDGVPEAIRGTCAGLAHPAAIAHLTRLGVTTVELMPVVAAVDERHLAAIALTNYWRYNPVAWFVPEPHLAPGGLREFASCVAALHAAGIEVVQDIVLNHTGEGDAAGPTLSLRGLDNATYYRTDPDAASGYVDDTGCGNTLALDRPPMLRLALDSLRHFAQAAGVDGFRFDLGTTLGRRADGFDPAAPLLQAIAQDPVLRELKMIVEPWDVGPGGYRLGAFPAAWGEWNDRCRDTIRRFWRGDDGVLGDLATRISGSSDIFSGRVRPPSRSVNFVTAHDGFTLADLVSYTEKHNDANGENNRDGSETNYSWNHGAEGPMDNPAIIGARKRDARSLLATLMVARGTPMISMGDELGRTQAGNNNAYAQDNPLTWIDWARADDLLIEFVAHLCALRRARPALRADGWLTGNAVDRAGIADVEWRCPDGHAMDSADWTQHDRRALVVALYAPASATHDADRIAFAINTGATTIDVRWPDPRTGFAWRCLVDTWSPSGRPLAPGASIGNTSSIAARSVVVLGEEAADARAPRRSGAEPAVLARLVAAAGIATEWWDVDGNSHRVSVDTQRALLDSMGLSATSTDDARARLRELAAAGARGALPAVIVTPEGGDVRIPVTLAGAAMRAAHRLQIRCEDGSERIVSFGSASPRAQSSLATGDSNTIRQFVTLPALPRGAHRVVLDDDFGSCDVVVTSGRCFVPEEFAAGARRFGLAANLYALRRAGDQGIGDFTTLSAAAHATARAGGTIVGINPLHALFPADRERASPYHPSDRRFIDPLYIDVERVTDIDASREARAVLAANQRSLAALATRGDIDYVAVWQAKRAVLDACFATFDRRPEEDPLVLEFDAFVLGAGASLATFAIFEAIAAAHPRVPWQRWPSALRSPATTHVGEFAAQHARDVRFAMYMQWQADRQLREVAAKARDAGLVHGIYRDLAIGSAADGAEAWANSGLQARAVSIGAPPDPFSPSGQTWDLPPPIPHRLAASAYREFRDVLAANMRHAGALRIDHVMGLARLFWIPEGARAVDGAYISYPVEDLLGVLALESQRARCIVVGEDLGTVPAGLRERLAAADVQSYRVLWFERDAAGFNASARYPVKAAACVSTHDLPTIAGWWSGADITEKSALGLLTAKEAKAAQSMRAADKALLADALNRDDPTDARVDPDAPHDAAITAAVHRHLALSPSLLVLVQADDLAGETVAENLPGTDRQRPNWRRKVGVAAASLWNTGAGRLTEAACAARREPDGAPVS